MFDYLIDPCTSIGNLNGRLGNVIWKQCYLAATFFPVNECYIPLPIHYREAVFSFSQEDKYGGTAHIKVKEMYSFFNLMKINNHWQVDINEVNSTVTFPATPPPEYA